MWTLQVPDPLLHLRPRPSDAFPHRDPRVWPHGRADDGAPGLPGAGCPGESRPLPAIAVALNARREHSALTSALLQMVHGQPAPMVTGMDKAEQYNMQGVMSD